jgi:hypothetical protein
VRKTLGWIGQLYFFALDKNPVDLARRQALHPTILKPHGRSQKRTRFVVRRLFGR